MSQDSTVDSAMQGAVFRGMYQSTSNCTWEQEYISLGFDSSCADVTAETISSKRCDKRDVTMTCNFTTPGNVSLTTHLIATDWQTIGIVNATSLLGKAGGLVNTGGSKGNDFYESIPSGLVRTAIWTNISDTITGEGDVDSSSFQDSIVECTLSIVAWRYSNVFSISNNFNIGTKEKIPLGRGFSITMKDGALGAQEYWFNQTSLPNLYVLSTNIGALVSFFTSPAISGQMLEGESMPPYTQGITAAFTNQNATTIFTKVAESMTGYLQESKTSILAPGLTSKAVVYIRVRWIWLALPLIVELAGAALLVVTIFSSRRGEKVPLWKSSSAALLFHRVGSDGSMSSEFKGPEELNGRVKRLKARLE